MFRDKKEPQHSFMRSSIKQTKFAIVMISGRYNSESRIDYVKRGTDPN